MQGSIGCCSTDVCGTHNGSAHSRRKRHAPQLLQPASTSIAGHAIVEVTVVAISACVCSQPPHVGDAVQVGGGVETGLSSSGQRSMGRVRGERRREEEKGEEEGRRWEAKSASQPSEDKGPWASDSESAKHIEVTHTDTDTDNNRGLTDWGVVDKDLIVLVMGGGGGVVGLGNKQREALCRRSLGQYMWPLNAVRDAIRCRRRSQATCCISIQLGWLLLH